MLFHLKVYDDPVLLKAQKKEAEMKRKEAVARLSTIITILIIMTTIREEKRRLAKHKREREGRHRGWNLIREKYNIKREGEEEDDSEDEGGSSKVDVTEEEKEEGRIMTEAKIQAVERIEDATSLVSGLLTF